MTKTNTVTKTNAVIKTSNPLISYGLVLLVGMGAGAGLLSLSMWWNGPQQMAGAESGGEKTPLYWVAPMDPNYRRDEPGLSPMGMELIPVYDEAAGDSSVTISATVENNLGLRLAEVSFGELPQQINTVGYIQFDEDRLSHIHTRVEGWVEKLNVAASGDRVKSGQELFSLYAPALVNAQEEYLGALRSGNQRLIKASHQRLLLLGLQEQQISALKRQRQVSQRISVYAQHSGYVSTLNVREGMFVRPANEVMAIGDLSSVWVIAEVFERQAGWLRPGQPVTMQVDSYPGEQWRGEVAYIYPELDAKTRTAKVRIEFANNDQRLKTNMFADLSIMAGDGQPRLSVPRQAVIRGGRYDRVVKLVADEGERRRFRSVLVKTGIETAGRVEILDGLAEGDQVVISAQFLIDSESNIDADLARMEEEQESTGTEPGRVWVAGDVTAVMAGHRMLTVHHAPIPEWQWPAMTMDFDVAEGVDLSSVSKGRAINFCLDKLADGGYLITHLELVGEMAPGDAQPSVIDTAEEHGEHSGHGGH